MLSELAKSATQSVIDRGITTGGPALIFWSIGLLAWMLAERRLDVLSPVQSWMDEAPLLTQVLALLWVVVLISASAVLVARLVLPVLKLLEGYNWPRWAHRRREAWTEAHWQRHQEEDKQFNEITGKKERRETLTAEEAAEMGRLEMALHGRPSKEKWFLPTRTGNVLRAGETAPLDKYGLNAVALWPHLWLLMPEDTRRTVAEARGALNAAIAAAVWGMLFATVVPFGLITIGVSTEWDWSYLLVAAGSFLGGTLMTVGTIKWWIPERAELYGRLIESVFDVHRGLLYDSLRWPRPANPQEELGLGLLLSDYLWRGSDDTFPRFVDRTPPSDP